MRYARIPLLAGLLLASLAFIAFVVMPEPSGPVRADPPRKALPVLRMQVDPLKHKNYVQDIPKSKVKFEMIAIPGGTFQMGSPAAEKGRQPVEGPQHWVTIKPFWMEKTEVTWDEFDLYWKQEDIDAMQGDWVTRDYIVDGQPAKGKALADNTMFVKDATCKIKIDGKTVTGQFALKAPAPSEIPPPMEIDILLKDGPDKGKTLYGIYNMKKSVPSILICLSPLGVKDRPGSFESTGQYLGESSDKAKLGATVSAQGDGKYFVTFYPGGLPGKGGNRKTRAEAKGTTKKSKVAINGIGNKWTATIEGNKLIGKTGDGKSFSLAYQPGKSTIYQVWQLPANQAADAITRPTPPYVDETYGHGREGRPAICMTHHTAMEYCRWLSKTTGKTYRLPTEAEWEWACRAGTTTAYSFGDDPKKLGEYAWFGDNADDTPHKVGTKKPNPWGLHDMHGNVMEWCLDQYSKDYYGSLPRDLATTGPVVLPTDKRFAHVARGGNWGDEAAMLRSAARQISDPTWIKEDPQLPQSIWWLTNWDYVGFRVICPVEEQSNLKKLRSKVTVDSSNY